MRKLKITLSVAALFIAGMVSAQVNLGTIKGVIVDEASKEPIPNARVWVEGHGNTTKMAADIDGKFAFKALTPGTYNLYSYSTGKDTTIQKAIIVASNGIADVGRVVLREKSTVLGPYVYVYEPPLIEKDVQQIKIGVDDIEHSPLIQNPKELFAAYNSDIIIQEGTSDMIIRGSRPGDVVYYVDGVKSQDLNGVPGVGIGGMTGYTGGVPAKYGDTTGGVVVLETKSYFDLYYAWLAGKK
ncbi:carboxypeptidase-like regulatory domain-containing protein [Paracrocinitomix mangrovi]|uniref:carboxypeptidase regulatory-like domain-containing protein n=1 Tax=Paracrocinitomix mangrovi TaxID=2862509 RepID=UPI001C8E29DE|nr:carboxypeptidase regulatory-like domain-containing protein [Paracrocinitomix mangrovi]UKN00152.1 carboxypeptidase-like regulatory domain-containing protein [Paracrocinitomix mangrovi]